MTSKCLSVKLNLWMDQQQHTHHGQKSSAPSSQLASCSVHDLGAALGVYAARIARPATGSASQMWLWEDDLSCQDGTLGTSSCKWILGGSAGCVLRTGHDYGIGKHQAVAEGDTEHTGNKGRDER